MLEDLRSNKRDDNKNNQPKYLSYYMEYIYHEAITF